jgi:adenylyltransferase/sulfurtransferase
VKHGQGRPAGLSGPEKERYRRQIVLPGWGEEAQERLARATLFVAGAGGLGSAAVLYLAAAGVGRLRLCDSGRVELSNLNRQILYTEQSIGGLKARSARAAVAGLNRSIRVEPLAATLADSNVQELVGDADLIVDCLDTLAARLVLNRFAVKARVPLVHAGVRGLGGQVTFVHHPHTPCLACLFGADAADPPAVPDPPILGAVAGVMGCLQAVEALKHLAGTGASTRGRVLFWDGATQEFDMVDVGRDPCCPVCG